MLWEKLVTDGHVQGARLRAAQPALLLGAILLCIIGGFGALIVSSFAAPAIDFDRSGDDHREEQQRLNATFNGMPAIGLNQEEMSKLAPAFEIEAIIRIVTDALNDNGKLPESLPFAKRTKLEFWRLSWSIDKLQYLRKDDILLMAAILSDERQIARRQARTPARPPVRWIGLFRRNNGTWRAYSLSVSGFYTPDGRKNIIDPLDYPISLKPFLLSKSKSKAAS